MLLLDNGYMEIRNKYIRTLSNHTLSYSHIRKNNVKELLLTKTQNISIINNKEYLFTFNENDLIKALLGDIFMFYIKSVLQKNDFEQIKTNSKISANWNIVTNYYKSFYNACLLLRLCYRGNIFFDSNYKKKLERIVTIHIGEIIELDSNMFYYIENTDGVLKLRLTKSENNTHEVVWRKVNDILEEMLPLSNPKSEEKVFILSCIEINSKLKNTFPSKMRNAINYQPVYGLDAIEKKLYPITQNGNWIKEIMSFDVKEIMGNINRTVNVYSAYTIYIEKLSYRLMQDYFEMNGKGDFILAKINKLRQDKIDIVDIPFSYSE